MPNKILVTYATRYGSTQEVAETIAKTLREGGLEIDIRPMKDVKTLSSYSAVVMGAPLYIGKWHVDAHHFLSQHQESLMHRAVAAFALGPIGTDEQEMQGSRQQLDKDLAQYPWLNLLALEMFVGKYDPAKLNFTHRLLAALPASPLHGMTATDHRDWEAIRIWANTLPTKLGQQIHPTPSH
jgi:menaquinone-dependent protoporphyrinogen oxidase